MVYGGDIIGMQLDNGLPESHLGFLDSHMAATPERVREARLFWPERDPADFDAYGRTGRKIVDRESGAVYVLAEHDPLQGADQATDTIEFFLVHSDWLWFLKPLGAGVTAGTGLSASTFGGVIKKDFTGRPVVIDAAGNDVPTRLLEGRR